MYPTIVIIDGITTKKFKYPGTLAKMTEKHFMKFLISFDDEKLKPFFRSAPSPTQEENDKRTVKILTADNHNA